MDTIRILYLYAARSYRLCVIPRTYHYIVNIIIVYVYYDARYISQTNL